MEIVFNQPIMLIFFLLIPLLIVLHYYFFHHNKRRAMKFANFSAMKRVTGTHLITKNTSQLVIRIVIFSLLILSSAKPVVWYEGIVDKTDYVIALDNSASMTADDLNPNRLSVAKLAAVSFIDNIEHAKIGFLTFSGISIIKVPLTTDKSKLKHEVMNTEIELAGGTDIASALITASNLLASSENKKTIVLITDGSDTSGGFIEESIEIAVDYLKKNHVIVYVVGIGTGLGSVGYIEEKLRPVYNPETLKFIAESSGGKFFEGKNTAEISAAFKNIESAKEKSFIPYDVSGILFMLAFFGLIFEWGLLNTKFRALP